MPQLATSGNVIDSVCTISGTGEARERLQLGYSHSLPMPMQTLPYKAKQGQLAL